MHARRPRWDTDVGKRDELPLGHIRESGTQFDSDDLISTPRERRSRLTGPTPELSDPRPRPQTNEAREVIEQLVGIARPYPVIVGTQDLRRCDGGGAQLAVLIDDEWIGR